jgi:hypothetical protein
MYRIVDDTPAQYSINSDGQRYEPNMPFEESRLPSEVWKVAPHHGRGPDSFSAERVGEVWDQLAISCVLRDRHFVKNRRRTSCQQGVIVAIESHFRRFPNEPEHGQLSVGLGLSRPGSNFVGFG